jgi:spermidine synthase
MATGVRVFPFGMRLVNFMVVSDTALQLDAQHWRDVLLQYRIDGKPVFDVSQEHDRRRLNEVLQLTATMDRALPTPFTLESADHIRARTSNARIITDDNMGTEWFQQEPE